MDGMDFGGLMQLMGGFQQKMQQVKEQIAKTEVEGTASGGLVKVRMTGDYQVLGVEIAADAMEDRELLEDLVRAAIEEATRRAREEASRQMEQLTAGLPIPPGMLQGLF